ncbi:ABC transporter substrate-binding protein [Frigidibacter sp. SD6-1]|uniref:ABC transporter substrate-binding protein n=1 Tax=Frigidibacter sp. SD6-1 TaxID=3032581 RepID=UPI0024DF940D|nr:ABC transporter substrate-binding protein [Frigidibacter sp. SD6-1]
MRRLFAAASVRLFFGALWLALVVATTARAFEIEAVEDFGSGAQRIDVLSTTDIAYMQPVIDAYLARHPDVTLHYVVASSQEVYRAVAEEDAPFDLVISSAMDLQMKIANDGLARPLPAALMSGQPGWARWRGLLVAVTQEPVVLLLGRDALPPGVSPPTTRRELIDLLRDHPDRFRGKVATYDPAVSGAGYLFAVQDARLSDAFWRLAEVMGRLDTKLYCCSAGMIGDIAEGRMLLGYNVLGSYAPGNDADGLRIVELQDYTLTLLRTALVPQGARAPEAGAEFLAFLLSAEGQALVAEGAGLPALDADAFDRNPHLRPIRLDPGLLANLDQITRRRFLEEWRAALIQP